MKFSTAILAITATLISVGAAEARSGFVKTADGKCHYCDTNKTPMCFELNDDRLCKQYGSKTFPKISLTDPFGEHPAAPQPKSSTAAPRIFAP